MKKSETYISVDIETDGPIPGVYSMVSLGAAAFDTDGCLLSVHSCNIQPLPGAIQDPATMEWWRSQPDAWEDTQFDPIPAEIAMQQFAAWVKEFSSESTPVFVGYPASFDFLFVYWYLIKFLGPGGSPFSFSALDIKTYAMAVMGCGYREVSKKSMKKYLPTEKHTHIAVQDAIEQGKLFFNLRAK